MYKEYDNPMRRQIYSVEALVQAMYKETENNTRKIITTPEMYSLKEVIITGCGDSYCAALAAKEAWKQFAGLSVQVLPAIELARTYPKEAFGVMPNNPLVIGISNSGKVTRVAEAVARARRFGALTLALTSGEDSPLAREAERTVLLTAPKFEKGPGVRNYVVSTMALCFLAIRFGEVLGRYTMDMAQEYRKTLLSTVEGLSESLEKQEEGVFKLAERMKGVSSVEILAQSEHYACSVFLQQKVYEAVGIPCVYGDGESWFHSNKFLRNFEQTLTLVYLSKGDPGKSRLLEAMKRMDYMGREYIVVTNDEDLNAQNVVYYPEPLDRRFVSMVDYAVASLLISYLTELKGETYSRGFQYPFCDAPGVPGTVSSEMEIV